MKGLKKARLETGLTMKEISKKLDITENYLYMLETGVRTPSLSLSKKISEFYGKSIDELFFANKPNDTLGETKSA